MTWVERNDNEPGYVYLVKAQGFHGILSKVIGRYKIGLSRKPELRLEQLNSSQAPCPITGLRYIQVQDMKAIEDKLHEQFKSQRRHGEWFDFWFWQMPLVNLSFDRKAKGTLLGDLHLPSAGLAMLGVMVLGGAIATVGYLASSSVQYQTEPVKVREYK